MPACRLSVGNWLKLERHCPHCGRFGGNIHSGINYRAVTDIKVSSIPQRRMKCPFCGTTWTTRADGIGHGKQRSDRLVAIGVVLYMFGLSYRAVEKFLPLLGCIGKRSSIERGVAAKGSRKICLAHWRKSKCRRAWQLYRQLKAEGLKFEAGDMLKLLELLKAEPRPPILPESVEKLVRRYINCRKGLLWKVNQLLQHIERTWEHVSSNTGDRTNNTTERIIGLNYKFRAKTARGLKAWPVRPQMCSPTTYPTRDSGPPMSLTVLH